MFFVVYAKNVPNKYSTLKLNKFCKKHSLEVELFVNDLFT